MCCATPQKPMATPSTKPRPQNCEDEPQCPFAPLKPARGPRSAADEHTQAGPSARRLEDALESATDMSPSQKSNALQHLPLHTLEHVLLATLDTWAWELQIAGAHEPDPAIKEVLQVLPELPELLHELLDPTIDFEEWRQAAAKCSADERTAMGTKLMQLVVESGEACRTLYV